MSCPEIGLTQNSVKMDNVSKVISGQDKYRKCECESGSEENISSVFALAPTLALFSVPRTDESCNLDMAKKRLNKFYL